MGEHLSGLILKDAFISYGRKDASVFASTLQKRMKKDGMYAWFDANDIPAGVDWQKKIYKGIDEAHNFLFIISPHSVVSKYCFKELKQAVKRGKRIIPLLCEKPTDAQLLETHPIVNEINWIDFTDAAHFDESYDTLRTIITTESDYVLTHTNILLKALLWEDSDKPNELLLHSAERERAETWLLKRYSEEVAVCSPSHLHADYICESIKNAENLQSDVLFYSVTTDSLRDQIRRALHLESITTWRLGVDTVSDTDRHDAIKTGILGADNVLFFISKVDLESPYMEFELNLALDFHKRIIPIVTEAIESLKIPLPLRNLQAYDFSRFDKELYESEISKLIRHINDNADYHHLHKNFLVQAHKWEAQSRNKSILLRGARLEEAQLWLRQAKLAERFPPTKLHEEFIEASLSQGIDSNSDVFICYSRVDSDFARKLNNELQVMGRTTWFDVESIAPGRDFEQEINQGIMASDNIIFLISPSSIISDNCLNELQLAETYNKRFINILAQSIGNDPLPKEVEKIHWIDFTRYQKDFHKPLSELLRTLENEREEAREHTIWLRAAQKWESHKKISSRLLKGDDYRDASLWIQATTKNPNIPQPTPLVVEYISKSKQAIDQELAQEARRQKKLRNALVLVTFFLLISIGLGLYAYKQRLQLEDVFSKLEKEKALSDEKSQRLEDAMKSVTESSKNAELANYETLRLRLERDSALLRANSSDEQLAIKQQYAEQISRQKEISDREMQRQKNQSDKIQADLAKQKKALERIKENTVDLGDGYVYFEGLTKINRDNLWGYMDKQHTLVINPQYATATDFSNGVAHVSRNGKHAFINKQDQTISGWFDRLEPFIDGIAEVRRGNESAFINTKGEIISLWFNEMFDFHDDLAKVRIDDKWGYVNKQGVLVIKARFDYAFGFRKGKAKVRIGTTEFFIDTKGQTTTPDRSLQLYDN